MILFIGKNENGFFASDIAKEFDESIVFTDSNNHIENVLSKFTEKDYTHIIVDCNEFIDDYKTISQHLRNIKNVVKANIIIMAIGFDVESELIQALAVRGFRNFMTSVLLSERKEQLKNCINNINSILDELPTIETADENSNTFVSDVTNEKIAKKTIAFGGSTSRIGTTTQAIQYLKYLQYMGKAVCYVEMNNNGFVKELSRIFEIPYLDEELGKLSYQSITMFDKPQNIDRIIKEPFEFFVYDFGSFKDKTFNLFSFVEKDIKVCVCGSKVDEIRDSNKLIERTYNNDVFYLFNYTAETEQQDVLSLMNNRAKKTIFAECCFDYFTYKSQSNNLYSKISPVKNQAVKKKFFNWREK